MAAILQNDRVSIRAVVSKLFETMAYTTFVSRAVALVDI